MRLWFRAIPAPARSDWRCRRAGCVPLRDFDWRSGMAASLHPAAPHDLPAFIAAPGGTDVVMVVMGVFLIIAVLAVGLLFLRLHTLPERMAHKSHKIQFEIVAPCWACWPSSRISCLLGGRPAACHDRPPRHRLAAAPDGGVARKDGRHQAGRGRGRGSRRSPPVSVPAESPAAGSDKSVVHITPREVRPRGTARPPSGEQKDLSHA